MTVLDILAAPSAAEYRALLAFLAERAASFSLVWRSDGNYEPSADIIRGRLTPYLLRTEGTARWPGTQYFGGLATVRHYATTPAAIAVLAEPGDLYAWRSLDRPEDLAFYDSTGAVLFGSIAHEQDSWFELGTLSEVEVRAALPSLRLRRRASPASPATPNER